jgi:hypothetical protein
MLKKPLALLFFAFAFAAMGGCASSPSPPKISTVVEQNATPQGSGRMVVLMITDNIDHVYGSGPKSIAPGVIGNAQRMNSF